MFSISRSIKTKTYRTIKKAACSVYKKKIVATTAACMMATSIAGCGTAGVQVTPDATQSQDAIENVVDASGAAELADGVEPVQNQESQVPAVDYNKDIYAEFSFEKWNALDLYESESQLRAELDAILGINPTEGNAASKKDGIVYIDSNTGNLMGNNTLFNVFMNENFRNRYWNNFYMASSIEEKVLGYYTDIDPDTAYSKDELYSAVMAYFNILDDNDNKVANIERPLTINEALANFYKANNPYTEELTANGEYLRRIGITDAIKNEISESEYEMACLASNVDYEIEEGRNAFDIMTKQEFLDLVIGYYFDDVDNVADFAKDNEIIKNRKLLDEELTKRDFFSILTKTLLVKEPILEGEKVADLVGPYDHSDIDFNEPYDVTTNANGEMVYTRKDNSSYKRVLPKGWTLEKIASFYSPELLNHLHSLGYSNYELLWIYDPEVMTPEEVINWIEGDVGEREESMKHNKSGNYSYDPKTDTCTYVAKPKKTTTTTQSSEPAVDTSGYDDWGEGVEIRHTTVGTGAGTGCTIY